MSFAAVAIGGAGIGLIGGIGKMFQSGAANKSLSRLQKLDPVYKENPMAKQRLGLAQSLLNARMPGASNIERNIYGTQANAVSNINRNATDSSQALALGAATQGQANQSFNQLGAEEAQDYQRRYGNYTGAQEGVINEQDKVYQDQVRRFGDLAQIRGMQNANRQQNWKDISNLGFGAMNFGMAGMSGGMGNLFGNGGGNSQGGGAGGNGGIPFGTPTDRRNFQF